MKLKNIVFVIAVMVVAIICIGIMNIRFDRLSRYPYEDEQARAIIKENFSDEDIEYLIEYSIAPSTFLRYVPYEGFSVYHAEAYNTIRDRVWYLTDEEVVKIVELSLSSISMDQLAEYLINYDGVTVFHYFEHKDQYIKDSILISNPHEINAYVDNTHTVSTRILFDTAECTMIPSAEGKTIVMAKAAAEPLKAMCEAITSDFGDTSPCGGLVGVEGYIDYEAQKQLYEAAIKQYGDEASKIFDYPGHSEHQLGLAIDFMTENHRAEDFEKSEQYKWLKENAYRFGFVETYTKEYEDLNEKTARPWHWRYVGHELAAQMHFNSQSLKEAISWQE